MKHHKQFRTALSVSIQERRELFPELTDADVLRALKTIVDKIAKAMRERELKRRYEAIDLDLLKLKPRQPIDEAAIRARAEQSLHWAQEMERQRQERQEQRELSLRMIDLGYKALAKELHPDKGGSSEVMARLNRARAHQKQMS
jgi:hypothetical protein